MNNHLGSAKIFKHFSRITFGSVYFTGKKTFTFDNKLDILGFEGTSKELRSSTKHWDKVKNWNTPKNWEELDFFL